ncbi:MAG: hypothetical protein DI527_00630 [Chelatococcus sp.]|nr:MAG: hypothetical protein DI527_00630 [Chelatococcus sp.]
MLTPSIVADTAKARRVREPREIAARALCRRAGHPENTKFEGKPMWMSFLPDADAVLAALASGA